MLPGIPLPLLPLMNAYCKIFPAMYLDMLQKIRKELLVKVKAVKTGPMFQKALGRGASGDMTFLIDRVAEDTIIEELDCSDFSLTAVSEEMGVRDINGGGKKVLIDPVDGSKNAISGIPFYCSSIAIAGGDTIGSIETAYVVNLVTGDEFRAEKGKGTFLNGKRISAQKDRELYLTAYEAQSPSKDIQRIMPLLSKSHKTRCLGATALDLSYLAYGAVSVFANPSLSRSFDFAAGYLLVKEAGGAFTDIDGNSIESAGIGLKRNVSLLASGNEKLHEKALRLLNK